MRKLIILGLMLTGWAAALQPRDVVREFAAGMNLIKSSEPACARFNKAMTAEWYPTVPTSPLKFITGESFRKHSDLDTTRTLVDIHMMAVGAKPYNAWDETVRMYTHPSTPRYIYYLGIKEKDTGSEYDFKTAVCVAIIAIRN